MIRIMKYGVEREDEIFSRSSSSKDVSGVVSQILKEVQERGDKALIEYTAKLDGALIDTIEVPRKEIEEAAASMDGEFMRVLEKAAENILPTEFVILNMEPYKGRDCYYRRQISSNKQTNALE